MKPLDFLANINAELQLKEMGYEAGRCSNCNGSGKKLVQLVTGLGTEECNICFGDGVAWRKKLPELPMIPVPPPPKKRNRKT